MKSLNAIIFISIFTGFLASSLSAQNWSLGPTAGVNVSKVSGDGTSELSYTPGFIGGVIVNYSNNSRFGISGKVLYAQYGAENDTRDTKLVLNYVQVPMYFVHYFGAQADFFRPKIYIGPYVSFLVSAKDGNGNDVDPGGTAYNNVDGGFVGGAGFNYRLFKGIWLNTDIRYSLGVADIDQSNSTKTYNHGLAVMLGVAFALTPDEY